ncbi:MAG: diguanylate cyclase/phosphodiesterase (GGDEF & EAL domains) with PAS/PAC sensor(s) [uncultured Sphingomonas sp.]|uniref:Diguanylate cyclase/phosphodiesterase (GGDEF & EAL domains) with PAS/PAC sensor(S) n=1 Tax=uncultured Sphingomonas sp. TaxID=158754 RepID=A0A6J4SQ84_9SPHN|nr:EAL domain-containing protein [uncultured Sphingomonas sp.]CAA9502034.1 MAG: diguanylate cyclase/phosphodiesterase (GGDEF & EAL domains) with PAS/PAC sensor(s) [uncultured Sphingomonas sp.]
MASRVGAVRAWLTGRVHGERRNGVAVRLFGLPLVGFAALFVVAATYTSVLIVERQDTLRQVSRYNVAWVAGQAVAELAKLQQQIAAFSGPDGHTGKEQVELRLDILANRVGLLRRGEVRDLIGRDPELVRTIDELEAAVAAAEPLVERLEQPGSYRALQAVLGPLEPKLARLASAANALGGDHVAEDQRELSRLHWIFSGILLGLIFCGLSLVGLLLLHNRVLRRTHAALLARTAELDLQNERFDAALNNMSQALCMVDGERRLIVCNRRYMDMFGLSPAQVAPRTPMSDILAAIASAGRPSAELAAVIHEEQEALVRQRLPSNFVSEHADGGAVSVCHRPMPGGGWVATYEDVTERRRAEARIAHMAHHDALTGLPNRLLLRERLEQELAALERVDGRLAVLCIDLDHFKDVNDTLGHPAGDALLQAVAERLRRSLRDVDTVARLSGDEFAVLVPASGSIEGIRALAERLLRAIGEPYRIVGHQVVANASLGIALAPADGARADDLLKNADMALYEAKGDGRGVIRFFERAMQERLQTRRKMEMDLRRALARREFEVFYQPIYDLEADRVGGFEALIRWRHPELGLVPPAEFIPVAEDSGLIVPIGEWVLRQACAEAGNWPGHLGLAVNLSPVQFRSPTLIDAVADALSAGGIAASRLEFEVTESLLLQQNDAVLATLHRLRGLGLRIALDDFGTGYSSLSYLRSFPFGKIKIDRSFVREMAERQDCASIVGCILGLAASLGMRTTAEGVETEEQLLQLRRTSCTEVQGYYIGRPMPAAEALAMLACDGGRVPARTAG